MFKKLIEDATKVINEGAFVNLVIKNNINNVKEDERKIYTRLLYGVVENKKWLDFLLKPYVSGRRFKPFFKNALRVGIYAIGYMNLPNHYIVYQIVDIVKMKDFKCSKAINYILRNFEVSNRKNEALEELMKLDKNSAESIMYNIDEEILQLIKKQYPDNYHDILKYDEDNFNIYRINYLKCNNQDVIDYLEEFEIEYKIDEETLITKTNLIYTPLFDNAYIIPQDSSSIKVAKVLNPKEGKDVLDVCAAPGSKSFHIATLMNNLGSVTSCDIYEHKIKLIEEEAKRLGISIIKGMLADATSFDYGKKYEYVLCDAPCSGMGTMKHKGDLKLKLTLQKVNEIVDLQKQILDNVSKYVKTGGILVYSTCTINKDENENQMRWFINKYKEFEIVEEISLLPTSYNDGFYICKLKKN